MKACSQNSLWSPKTIKYSKFNFTFDQRYTLYKHIWYIEEKKITKKNLSTNNIDIQKPTQHQNNIPAICYIHMILLYFA